MVDYALEVTEGLAFGLDSSLPVLDVTELADVAADRSGSWQDRATAANRLSGLLGFPITSQQPMTREQLAFEASLLGMELRPHAEISRFARREPEQVALDGFQPNPNKPPGTLFDHIERKSSSLVSCTLPGTEAVPTAMAVVETLKPVGRDYLELARDFIETHKGEWMKAMTASQSGIAGAEFAGSTDAINEMVRKLQQALHTTQRIGFKFQQQFGVELFSPFPQSYSLFEYRIANIEGVEIDTTISEFDFADQKEVTIRAAAPSQITHFREVEATVHWALTPHFDLVTVGKLLGTSDYVEFGEWKEMPKPGAP